MKLVGDKILLWAIGLIVSMILSLMLHIYSETNKRFDNIDGRIDAVILNAFDKP